MSLVYSQVIGKKHGRVSKDIFGVFETLYAIAKAPINLIIKGLNWMIDGINKIQFDIPQWVADLLGLQDNTIGFNIQPIRELALGGTLTDGEIFKAGEFGKAELIGSYNNKTTVMPLENSGFVEAMYKAVKSAVIDAEMEGNGQVIENVLNIDGEVIYRNQEKVKRNRGVNFNLGVFER